jgi:hypothetical protein
MRQINVISSEVWETLWTNDDAWADTCCHFEYTYHGGWFQKMQPRDWEYHGNHELIRDNRVWSVGPMLQTLWVVWWISRFWFDLTWHRQGCFTIRDLTSCNTSILYLEGRELILSIWLVARPRPNVGGWLTRADEEHRLGILSANLTSAKIRNFPDRWALSSFGDDLAVLSHG